MAKTKMSKKGKGGAGNPKFMTPVLPDKILGAIVGNDPLPRTQIVKKLWEYIKENGYQNGRIILAKGKLKEFFDGADTDMFQMQKTISEHLL
jgi:upstream activation factor subunit UAF30